MGGSNLGARIISSVFKDSLGVPMVIEPGYEVPGFTDEKTLYLLSSYSGSTEETLSVYDEVKKRGAKVIAITAEHKGNKLKKLMEDKNIPGFIFEPKNNPAGQPRLALGYSIFGIIALLSRAGVINVGDGETEDVINTLEERGAELGLGSPASANRAKQVASQAQGKKLIIVGAEFLDGNVHAMRNQICENSKNFSHYFSLPEMNHYLLEGLKFPEVNKNDLFFLFMNSDLYNPRVTRRAELTRQIVEKHGIDVMEFKPIGASKLIQSFEVLQFGSWLSFYLAMANGIDPAPIPWVDWFKEKLG
jgi:glucose/mannose-6-phosphate isomerase